MACNIRNVIDVMLAKCEHMEPSTLNADEKGMACNLLDILEGHVAGDTEVFESLDVDECKLGGCSTYFTH